jgi:hypothetical protein
MTETVPEDLMLHDPADTLDPLADAEGRHVQCRIELLRRKLRALAFSESFLVDPKSSDPIRAYRLFHASESRC